MNPPLVLLPGMMCDARLFSPQIAALSARRTVTVPCLDAPDSIEGMARRVLAETGSPVFDLAGLSMGGIVAMAMAAIEPQRIRRLVLLDTNHLADQPERRPVRERQIEAVRAGRLREIIVEEMKPNYLAAANSRDTGLLGLLIAMAMDCGPYAFVNQSLALRDRPDRTAALEAFAAPCLLICGAEDRLCPPSRHAEMAGLLRHARLLVVERAGHIATLEQPAVVSDAMARFLAPQTAG